MVNVGDDAPEFTGSLVTEEMTPFRLTDHLGDGPVVLAFFPAAFSGTCTDEMRALRDGIDEFGKKTTVLGVSTDLPHALQRYRGEYDLPFPLVADPDHNGIEAYDVVAAFDRYGVEVVARRAVFVIDADGTVTYRWLAENPGQEPDYDALVDAIPESTASN
ncbi:peroxiredoxin [Halorubrum alkaliphilum]|uniref:Peroxiredoxin n=1 Tax=Halorubrum alkaliphilum TaxID=261290 RepID=A0A8T4GDJ3_9EURY|nr:redoxin domain-containing protein [Halorubrum alkaliphilum]MBP1922518.1 peroxiredoxin [Halorubrum alkaliphilum]